MSDRTPASAGRGYGRGRGGSRNRSSSEDAMSDVPMEGALVSENILVQRQVVTAPGAMDVLAASQQLTYEQLKTFWDEHQALRRDTGEALGQTNEVLQQQHANQEALRVAVEQQAQLVAQQQQQLQAASNVVAHQQEQLQAASAASAAFQVQRSEVASLKEAVLSPRGQARWGMFAGEPARDEVESKGGEALHQDVLIAGGSMPIAPVYRGCTKKEKREFMDKYLSYQRRVEAMNECTGRRIALMPWQHVLNIGLWLESLCSSSRSLYGK